VSLKPDDVVEVGAGIDGHACARGLLARRPSLNVVVVEKESEVGRHQSSRNSGVVHSGLYYLPGSLKARLCVTGRESLISYCDSRGIAIERCGKLVVAVDHSEISRLEELIRRGRANGVVGLERVDPERIQEIEPHCVGLDGLWSPATSIVDFGTVVRAFAEDIRAGGGLIQTDSAVIGINAGPGAVVVRTVRGEIETHHLIACAGLHSDRVAAMSGAKPDPIIVPFRGSYWSLAHTAKQLVRNVIYPVPDPSLPFLGVHATRRVGTSDILVGPNAVLALGREAYSRGSINFTEVRSTLTTRAFARLARRHWRTGVREIWRDANRSSLARAVRRYLPDLRTSDLMPGPSGVRAQAVDRNGSLVDDFVLEAQGRRILHVRNAPSPAATSSLAIADLIVDRAFEAFDWGVA
jgi:L-2-hydroxyglutarate oxidase LhgO